MIRVYSYCLPLSVLYVIFIMHLDGIKCFNVRARGGCNNGRGYVMHEPKASALRNRDRYYILRVRHIKARNPSKCVINILLMITSPTPNHVPSLNR